MIDAGRRCGWQVEYLGDWNHPAGQKMLRCRPALGRSMVACSAAPPAIEPIIVVGPGRCGSSAVAGVLHHLGVFMGERLIPAHETNPYGHWEDADFVRVNEAFVMQDRMTAEEWSGAVAELIKKRRALGRQWGWKDPRTCQLLPQYLKFFENLGSSAVAEI